MGGARASVLRPLPGLGLFQCDVDFGQAELREAVLGLLALRRGRRLESAARGAAARLRAWRQPSEGAAAGGPVPSRHMAHGCYSESQERGAQRAWRCLTRRGTRAGP